jgi:hypothetical protein
MRVGDKVQYNKKYKPSEVVTILQMDKTHALIQFPTGSKIATPIAGLWPLEVFEYQEVKPQLTLF